MYTYTHIPRIMLHGWALEGVQQWHCTILILIVPFL
jgi:hypothetical protein